MSVVVKDIDPALQSKHVVTLVAVMTLVLLSLQLVQLIDNWYIVLSPVILSVVTSLVVVVVLATVYSIKEVIKK